jgi:hypothetical protein
MLPVAVLLGILAVSAAAAGQAEPGRTAGPIVAVLPPHSLTGVVTPIDEIGATLRAALVARGVRIVDPAVLDEFMARYRIRFLGGISIELGRAFREEQGVDAVLITSVDQYDDADPPKIAMTSRLVSTASGTRMMWMDGATRTGDQSPGFLSLGLIHSPEEVGAVVIDRIADSLAAHLSGEPPSGPSRRKKFRPRTSYRHPALSGRERDVRVAVVPFLNESSRSRAGAIVAFQFVRHLVGRDDVEIVEPGVVRHALLQSRLIMEDGLSYPQSDLLRALLDVDLVITGRVTEYFDSRGIGVAPRAVFAVRAIDTENRQVVWASTSDSGGDDRVLFFDVGEVYTTPRLVSEMARETVVRMFR